MSRASKLLRLSSTLRIFLLLLLVTIFLSGNNLVFAAIDQSPNISASDLQGIKNPSAAYYDPNSGNNSCSTQSGSSSSASTTSAGALDYAGNPIFTQEQLKAIADNQPFYESSAKKVDIPWQMLAVIHSNETGLKRENAPNGQGVYQFYDKHGGPYPAGPVDDAEFQRQTDLAAELVKSKEPKLTAQADAATVKNAFWLYNGAAYTQQAIALGFPADQGYEGSPYVMNKADAQRDPNVNKTTWGQVKHDNGPIEYPANDFYGAFVKYGALTGISSGSCSSLSGPVRDKVVQLLKQELDLWKSGQLKIGFDNIPGDYYKYSQNTTEAWCADFASWIYDQAGYPLTDSNHGRVASTQGVWDIGQKNDKFHAHPAGSGYQPKPGDLVLYTGTPLAHTETVVENKDGVLTVIAGNWGNAVTEHSYPVDDTNIWSGHGVFGYVSPD